MSKTAVSIICGVVLVAIIAWDLYLNSDKVKENTISARARALGRWWPPMRILIAFVLGLLMGHFWWTPQDVHDVSGNVCILQAEQH
jgi:hypothetical protein